MLEIGLNGGLTHFTIDLGRMDGVADAVVAVTRKAYPTLDIPFHARWRHFVLGGTDRWARLADAASWPDRCGASPRGVRPRDRQRAARRRRGRDLALPRHGDGRWHWPIRGACDCKPRHVRERPVFRRCTRALQGRCGRARKAAARRAHIRLSGERCQSAARPRRTHRPAATAGQAGRGPSGRFRLARHPAAGRPVRSHRSAGGETAPSRRPPSCPRC